ncbi:unnamed protein product [Leptosia nina]|uniref:FLYWCH-type domain-containing protein n=1 Tax=Leptosia nina TaxID=320188 RepID=A0AAV1J5Z3_9NEOP
MQKVEFIPSRVGKHPLLMFNKYTYKRNYASSNGNAIWYCSSRMRGCKAFVKRVGSDYIIGDRPHPHAPPSYVKTSNGVWRSTFLPAWVSIPYSCSRSILILREAATSLEKLSGIARAGELAADVTPSSKQKMTNTFLEIYHIPTNLLLTPKQIMVNGFEKRPNLCTPGDNEIDEAIANGHHLMMRVHRLSDERLTASTITGTWLIRISPPIMSKVQAVNGSGSKVEFIPSRSGVHSLLMFKKYTYNRSRSNIHGDTLWYCSSRKSGLCLLPPTKGKHPRLMVNSYTYKRQWQCNSGKIIWYCSSRNHGCKAYVHTLDNILSYGPATTTTKQSLDNGNASDDDVIEVVVDETPIEILSDGEELELEKIHRPFTQQTFEFTTPQTPESTFTERREYSSDPLIGLAADINDILKNVGLEPSRSITSDALESIREKETPVEQTVDRMEVDSSKDEMNEEINVDIIDKSTENDIDTISTSVEPENPEVPNIHCNEDAKILEPLVN